MKNKKIGSANLSDNPQVSTLAKFSHELKSPLHGILGIANFVKDSWHDMEDDQKKECINSIIEAGNNMSFILDMMMDRAQDKENIHFKFENIEISSFIQKAVSQFSRLYIDKKSIRFNFIDNEHKLFCNIDRFWLGQVIANTLLNAYNHMDSGSIDVEISEEIIDSNKFAIIDIGDEGPGVPENSLKDIFQPFNRGEKNSKGTGLGLNICREVVLAHGGFIEAKNKRDKGLLMKIYLPIN